MNKNLPINTGVVSRIYRWPDSVVSVAYHTPSRSATMLKGDSAEVWWRLYEAGGETSSALDYMMTNGEFDGDPQIQAREALADFRVMLEEANLIVGAANRPTTVSATTSITETINPDLNPDQKIGQLMADRHVLYSMVLETTYRCNEKCVHCYLPEQTGQKVKELSLAQIDSLLEEFSAMGGFSLLLTGGEVGVRKDFTEILALAKKYRFITAINSNLTKFSEEQINAIIDLHPKSVSCSIYSARPELHDAITQIPGSLERSMATVRRLTAAGVPVALKTPLMTNTAAHWREVAALADSLGCGFQMDLSITAKNDGGLSPLDHRVQDPLVLKDVFSSKHFKITVMDEPLQAGRTPDLGNVMCGAGACGMTISPDGAVRPCTGISEPMGHYPSDTLTSIWHYSPFFVRWAAMTLKDVPCGECAYFLTCSRCPGAWHAEHGSYTRPTDYNCLLARAWSSASQVDSRT